MSLYLFEQPGREFLANSRWELEETDWSLAHLALSERSFSTYAEDPRAAEAQKVSELFTAEEAQRVDAFLARGLKDPERLEAIAGADTVQADDVQWLITELRTAWHRLERLHDSVDNSGSLMATTYVASSVDIVRHSREAWAHTPTTARRSQKHAA
jgi:hypothetical protein